MAYSIDSTTDGCYPGTTCLVNKLGIQDELALAETEAAVVLEAVQYLFKSKRIKARENI